MQFNSIHFLFFFPIVIFSFFSLPHKFRWILLLAASYYFYMCWKAEYVVLILLSTSVDYFCARKMEQVIKISSRRMYLYISLMTNLGLLFSFKYFNFVGENVQLILNKFNIFYDVPAFNLLLPVGISFYTFQTLSYTIDVFLGRIKAERHFGLFAVFVSFFPQLVAGPIERGKNLLPQFKKVQTFNYDHVRQGLLLMLWGFFKKLVIADRLAAFVNPIYNNPQDFSGMEVLLATYAFAYQVFCDFSGYSDIAIGSAKIMGFDIMRNFKRPYFSKSPSEFWRRWHISLSTWLNDYVYMTFLARIRYWGVFATPTALIVTFALCGLWHGANWTFVFFGLIHGLAITIELLTKKRRKRVRSITPAWLYDGVSMLVIFNFWSMSLILWRSDSFTSAGVIFSNILNQTSDSILKLIGTSLLQIKLALFAIIFLELFHIGREFFKVDYQTFGKLPLIGRWSVYVLLTLACFFFAGNSQEFIYFQF